MNAVISQHRIPIMFLIFRDSLYMTYYTKTNTIYISNFDIQLLIIIILHFFFFSSRRRHTRLQGDWSSDVCSSDSRDQRDRRPGAGPAVPQQLAEEYRTAEALSLLLHPRRAQVVRHGVDQTIDELPVRVVGIFSGEDGLAADQGEAADLLTRGRAGAPQRPAGLGRQQLYGQLGRDRRLHVRQRQANQAAARLHVGHFEMTEEDHGNAALPSQRLRRRWTELRRTGAPQHRVGRPELQHLDTRLGSQHVLREAPRGEFVERALGILGRERDESDLTVRHEIEARRGEHAGSGARPAGQDDPQHPGEWAHRYGGDTVRFPHVVDTSRKGEATQPT